MEEAYYTHARWRVKPGREEEFVEAWRVLASFYASEPNAIGHGTLIRSLDDPSVFYAFGPWRTIEDIDAASGGPHSQESLSRLRDLCDEHSGGTYEVIAQVYPESR
ncbi:MAG TPA: antibiotic biosynthesis monooxygenase family protein [Chloroflexia bacterium]|nr:antibiotic biosynthesis monooxygenase family protein [Chloroflexia bacterium]